jgi:hypothetical protein
MLCAVDENERVIRHLVERSTASLRKPLTDLHAAYEHFGIPVGNSLTTAELSRVVSERIATVLRATGDAKSVPLKDIERHLVMRRVADGAELLECIALIAQLRDATRSAGWEARPLSDTRAWLEALGLARDHLIILGWSLEGAPFMNPRVVAVGAAARTVRKYGFFPTSADGRPFMTATEHQRLASEIDRRVRALSVVSRFAMIALGWQYVTSMPSVGLPAEITA